MQDITKSCESIDSLYFKPPGIFHNAMIHMAKSRTQNDKTIHLTRLIRDLGEDSSLYSVDDLTRLPKRKDGKPGIFDYLISREVQNRRNRSFAVPESGPVVRIPKRFYLKQQKLDGEDNSQKRRFNGNNTATTSSFWEITNSKDSMIIQFLKRKLGDDNMISNFIQALEDGSVILENNTSHRRETMFVEDFPIEVIMKVLRQLVEQWPLPEYMEVHEKLSNEYQVLSQQIALLKDEVQLHEDFQSDGGNLAAATAQDFIEKEQEEIRKLKERLNSLDR